MKNVQDLLMPLKYMGIYGEEDCQRTIMRDYTKAIVDKAFFDILRKQQVTKDESRAKFISAFTNVFIEI